MEFWEFAAAFGAYFFSNRLMMWTVARGIKGADIELWRGWQMWIWMAPNHLISICRVMSAEIPFLRWITRKKEIAFKVTSKVSSITSAGKEENLEEMSSMEAFRQTLWASWHFVVYYVVFIAAIIYCIVRGE